MSAPKLYTERDLILAKREGWLKRCRAINDPHSSDVNLVYPLPQIERPRVALDPWIERLAWRAMGGIIFASEDADREEWTHAIPTPVTADRVALWADLLANPTELVSDSGDTA